MSDKPANVKFIGQFPGYATNRDPHDQPEVAVDTNNMVFHEPGKLACRKGSELFSFSNDGADVDSDVISAFPYKRAGSSFIVHQDALGNVRVGRMP
tara:strand:+ start:256 stop:543 length:288 start_codon:yes stop_codon:yes gene_type:complete